MYEKLRTAAKFIESTGQTIPRVGVVLGSGLGAFLDRIEDPYEIPYSEIPFFKTSSVEGHEGRLIFGKLAGVDVAILQGRLHCHDGHPIEDVVFSVRVLATLGIETLVLTNAAGGINLDFFPGDLVLIKDHINLIGQNPLIGAGIRELGPRFPDMAKLYNLELREKTQELARELEFEVKQGVYASVLGPTYETPAEVKMLRTLGADMVGMSTVPESIAANHLGLKVVGISCISNMATGIERPAGELDARKEKALTMMENFSSLLSKLIETIGRD